MNRSVLDRQMFAKGGAAFPDLSGDGKVTRKDILMGRGVIPMQQGGIASMPQTADLGPQMMAPGMMPAAPEQVDINQAAQGAMQQGIDPAVLEGMLGQYASQMEDLENAEDYETVINGIRGDEQPIAARYEELAQLVGPEDARSTPESVLTLVQPVMQIATIDQGIGGLAEEQMAVPVEGDMAQGIMSTVNMGAEEVAPPANFSQGDQVVPMQTGGMVNPLDLQSLYQQQRDLYGQLYPAATQASELEEQKDLTKAQMLFDIAQGALAFASPSQQSMTPAEKLAQSFQPVLGNISARAGALKEYQDQQKARQQQLDLAALQSASGLYQSAIERQIEAGQRPIGGLYDVLDPEGNLLGTVPIQDQNAYSTLMQNLPGASIREARDTTAANYETLYENGNQRNSFNFNLGDPDEADEYGRLANERNPDGTKKYLTGDEINQQGLGSSFDAQFLDLISDAPLMRQYASGELDNIDPSQVRRINSAITSQTAETAVWNSELGQTVMRPGTVLSPEVLNDIEARRAAGLSVPIVGGTPSITTNAPTEVEDITEDNPGRVRFDENGNIDFSQFEDDPTFIISGIDLTKSTGWTSGVNRIVNSLMGQVADVLGTRPYTDSGEITQVADNQLNNLANQIMRYSREGVEGRIFTLDVQLMESEVAKMRPRALTTDSQARNTIVSLRNLIGSQLTQVYDVLDNRQNYSADQVQTARQLEVSLHQLLGELTGAVAIYDRFMTSNPTPYVPLPTTSSLPRLNEGN